MPIERRSSTVTIPERVGPHVKLVFTEMRRQGQTYDAVAAGSGMNRPTIKAWRHKNRPNLVSTKAVLGHLRYGFVTIPTAGTLLPEIVEALQPIAERLDLTVPNTIRLTAEVAYHEHYLRLFGSEPNQLRLGKFLDPSRAFGRSAYRRSDWP